MTVAVLIRRCVRPDRLEAFLASYKAERPNNPEFIAEYLTRLNSADELPPALRSFPIGAANAVVFVNVAFWKSAEAFNEHFSPKPDAPVDPNETEARVRAVLDVVDSAGGFPPEWSAVEW